MTYTESDIEKLLRYGEHITLSDNLPGKGGFQPSAPGHPRSSSRRHRGTARYNGRQKETSAEKLQRSLDYLHAECRFKDRRFATVFPKPIISGQDANNPTSNLTCNCSGLLLLPHASFSKRNHG